MAEAADAVPELTMGDSLNKSRIQEALITEIGELLEGLPAATFSSAEGKASHVQTRAEWCAQNSLTSLQVVWDSSHQKEFCAVNSATMGLIHFLSKALAQKCQTKTAKIFVVDGNTVDLDNQQEFGAFLKLSLTNGLIEEIDGELPSQLPPLLHTQLAMIKAGNRYMCSSVGKGCVLAEHKKSLQNHQGFVDKVADNFERAANERLGKCLQNKYTDVVPLSPKVYQTATGSDADGIFMVPFERKIYILEAKYTGDAQYSKAKTQLDGFEKSMKQHACFKAYKFVRVLAHTGISEETAKLAKGDRIELFEQKPCSFRDATWVESTVKPARRRPLGPVVKRKEMYEAQLAQIEKDIEKLSKKNIYVREADY